MTKKKKIIVRAYVNENLGDDLFLKILFERYSDVDFFLLDVTEKNCKAFRDYSNVHYIRFQDFFKRNKEFDGYIDIGGSIFIQEGKGLGGFKKRLLISLLLKYRKKKTFILGANFGPYNTNYFQKVYKYYFKFLVEDICFRDKNSYNLFSDLENVRYAPDIVFQLGEKVDKNKKVKNSLGISIMDIRRIPKLSRYYNEYMNKMISLVSNATKKGFHVHLISFCRNQGDTKAINNIISALDIGIQKKIEILEYKGNIKSFLKVYSTLENVVTLRFHSFILSLIYNQNIYPLIYSKKTMNVIEDLGSSIIFSEIQNIKDKDINLLLQEMQDNNINVDNLVNESKDQFKIFDMYIKDAYEHSR
jgi:colanic acid/amylovoran biosynthesis protein